jgi:RNA polymerase sigma-70 factor (ECF subfamily)
MSTGMDGEETKDGRGGRTTEDVFVEHYDFMFRAARKSLRNTEDAQDVIQNLYLKLIDSKLPPDVWRDPKGYLYRTVINACHDWRRARKSRRENRGVEQLEIREPRSEHANQNAAHEVEHLMGNLDRNIADIVRLHAEGGMSDAEIAVMVGGSRSKIAMILSRARDKLRKLRGGRKEKHVRLEKE